MGFGRRNGEHELDFGDDPGPRWLLLGIVAFVLVAGVVLFFAMRGSSQTAEGPPAGISTTEDFNPAGENTTESTVDSTTGSTVEDESTAKTTTPQTRVDGEGSSTGTDSGESADGANGSADQGILRAGTEPGGLPGAGGGEGDRQSESEIAAKETGVYDPAGRNPEPGDLTVTDEQRVEFAAAQFVTAVYGYTGTDAEEYRNEIDRLVAGEDFYESSGGQTILEYVEEVDVYGSQAAAKVDRFEVSETEPEMVSGTVHFVTAESYSRYGDLEGDKASHTQKLVLVEEGETYSVVSADNRESGKES